MNPGTWIMGGGGAGGGGGPGSGNGKNGAGGAGGPNDGKGGPGNGNGAGSCGQGGAGACTNCASKTSAGDPIDVVTGEVFTGWKTDLFLPGFFDFALERKYTTALLSRDVGLGFGWTHTLAWEIQIEENKAVLVTGTGFRSELPPLAIGEQVSADGWAILRFAGGFYLRAGSEFFHTFFDDPTDPSVARLVRVDFRDRGGLTLHYDRGRLVSMLDSADRMVTFDRDAQGRIMRVAVPEPDGPTTIFARYLYSDAGDLVQVTDADGFVTQHTYDDAHRLRSTTHPTGLVFHFSYDERGRGVETWGDYPGGVDPALASDVPSVLADGITPARGIHHTRLQFFEDGTSEVTDSIHFHRFFGSSAHPGNIDKAVDSSGAVTTRTLDDDGREVAHEDPLGAVWTWSYDELGEVVRETDPEGHTVTVDRDREGRILSILDPLGGMIVYGREASGETRWLCDQRGGTVQHVRDARGRLVEHVDRRGARSRYEHDVMGNLIEMVAPDGGVERSTYDYLGRRVSVVDALGHETRLVYSTGGNVLSITDSIGRITRFQYDGLGRIVAQSGPDGATRHVVRGGDGWATSAVAPDGSETRWLYNREGWMTHVINEKGEVYRFVYDLEGRVIEEHAFDGRVRKITYDARGRGITFGELDRGTTEVTRNLLGQMVSETTPTGETWTYEYDARGDLIRATGPETSFSWLRDAAGAVVHESLTVDGMTYDIESQLDAGGERIAYRTSLGHSAAFQRDARGNVVEAWFDEQPVLRMNRDLLGTTERLSLAGGGAIVNRRDDAHRLVARHVEQVTAGRRAEGERPDWVGGDGHWAIDTRFRHAANDEVLAVESRREGVLEYAYDVRRRLREKRRDGTLEEAFQHDPASNYFPSLPGDPPRVVDPGNRLVRQGDAVYRFDAAGLLRERRRAAREGRPEEITTYDWNDRDLLSRVVLPDGRHVAFAYDAFARRFRKTVSSPNARQELEPLRTVHYVWDLTSLRHEITYLPDGSRHERTFVAEEQEDVVPLGHRDDGGEWRFYVGDVNGAPQELIDAAGNQVGALTRSAFGRVLRADGATTDVRAPAQIEDEETGLHYNRYRYYDPEIGRFISPDPIGLEGGLNEYAYGPNPVAWFDAMGWAHKLTVSDCDIDGIPREEPNYKKSESYAERGEYPSGMRSKKGGGNDRNCPKELNNRAECHSERKLLNDLEHARKAHAAKPGNKGVPLAGKVTANGEYPPCPQCHRAMLKFAKENGTAITYKWDAGGKEQSITYAPEGKPAFEGSSAEKLEKGYALDPNKPDDKYGNEFKDGSAASKAYQKQKRASDAYKQQNKKKK